MIFFTTYRKCYYVGIIYLNNISFRILQLKLLMPETWAASVVQNLYSVIGRISFFSAWKRVRQNRNYFLSIYYFISTFLHDNLIYLKKNLVIQGDPIVPIRQNNSSIAFWEKMVNWKVVGFSQDIRRWPWPWSSFKL